MNTAIQLVIFDMDGTLYDRCPAIDLAYPIAAAEIIARLTGQSIEAAQRELALKKDELSRQMDGAQTNTLTLLHYYGDHFREYEERVNYLVDVEKALTPDPRLISTLKTIEAHYPIFLYTTNNGLVADRVLRRLEVDGFFPEEKRFSLRSIARLDLPHSEKLAYVKPGAKGFRLIFEKFGFRAAQTLMVGDSEVSDIRPAQHLGMHTYHVTDRESFYALPAWLKITTT